MNTAAAKDIANRSPTDGVGRESPLADSAELTWTPLGYFCLYRLAVATFFAVSAATGHLLRPLGTYDFGLFLLTSMAYLAFAALAAVLHWQRRPAFTAQAMIQIF